MPVDWFAVGRRFWWLIAAIAVVVLLLVVRAQIVAAWERINPFDAESRLAGTERELEAVRSELEAREAEIAGREAMTEASDQAQVVILETRTITQRAVTEAEGAPDAETPLGPERDARLRDWRERLCVAHPASCAGQPADD